MNPKKIIRLMILVAVLLSPSLVFGQELNFNSMTAEQNLFLLKNETQGTAWSDQIGASPGDSLSFKVYYHCGAKFPNQPLENAKNAKVRVTFPSNSQSVVVLSAQVLSDNAFSASDNGILNLSSSQKVVFDGTAQWFRNQDTLVSNIPVTITDTTAEVSFGDLGCDYAGSYANAGSVVFKAHPGGPILPKVTLKANGLDERLYLDYNSQATLTWTAEGADSCLAGGDWTGSRPTTGSELTSNLLTSKNYTLICTSSRGQEQDAVRVIINEPQTLLVNLTALPSMGSAPLNGVDLRATVSGTALGTINYKFDCTSDGVWEHNFSAVGDNPKTVVDACNYINPGLYTAKVKVERGLASAAEASVQIAVSSPSGLTELNVTKQARNLSRGGTLASVVSSSPGEVVEFQITVTSTSQSVLDNLTVKESLPSRLKYYNHLKVDDADNAGDILAGLNIGSLNPGQSRTVVFQVVVADSASFNPGTTDLVNAALVYNTNLARTATANVQVIKSAVKGATTISTGLFDNFKLAWLMSLALLMVMSFVFLTRFYFSRNKLVYFSRNKLVYLSHQSFAWDFDGFIQKVRERARTFLPKDPGQKAKERLNKTIESIKKREL